jgi:exportin-2 (importin alpha re-exporter)
MKNSLKTTQKNTFDVILKVPTLTLDDACDLVKALSKSFEVQMTEIFGRYVAVMLESYAQSPEKNWRSKDSAVYLIIALASKGQTARHGTTQTNQLVDLVDFFRMHIV